MSVDAGKDAKALLGQPVIAISEGRRIGTVHDVLFDPDHQALLGLMVALADGTDSVLFLDRAHLRGLGRDAVMVRNRADLRALGADERAHQVMQAGIHLGGAQVLTEHGDAIGKIDRVLVRDDGFIAVYEARTGPLGLGHRKIQPDEVVKIGEDAVIVAPARHDEAQRNGSHNGDGGAEKLP